MAKHSFQTIRRMRTPRLLILGALVWGLGISPSPAGQHIVQGSQPAPKPGQASGQTGSSVPSKSAQTPAQGKSTASISNSGGGKRDPFKLPEVATAKPGGESSGPNSTGNGPGANLPPGIRGLAIPHLVVEGVVREQTSNKMIAVVTNETKRAYFLHENDALYDGVVSKITPDTVIFKENVLDADGRVTTREVAKKLGAAPGEGR
jgi:hypothetical protein